MSRPWRLLLLPGDGIGPEVSEAAGQVLQVVAARLEERDGRGLEVRRGRIGGDALDREGVPLPAATLEAARDSDAVLLAAVGGPRWEHLPGPLRPEAGLLALRRELGVYANLRPAAVWPGLEARSPLRPEVVAGTDCLVVRELTGGLYYGQPRGRGVGTGGEVRAVDTMEYTAEEIRRVAHVAFRAARRRRRLVTSVDKANVLENSRLWREVVSNVAADYPDVRLEHQLVDSAAMLLASQPSRFDVILTENLFGDILSDLAGGLVGSLGLLPSASLGDGPPALYEPVHGSAPDIAGQDRANPLGMILSLAMLLELSLEAAWLAAELRQAVGAVLAEGWRTPDIAGPGARLAGTQEMGRRVARELERRTADAAPEPHLAGRGGSGGAAGGR
ncbi:MAG: 3-isopropylmalate dehydrogenase [Clostridia bacterium]|nr:3-isopropylmalate dehydrogenase [Clostridia bacterium]MCL6522768.1 3-isopropylmalate dehydrogenase [Bacillota bacterium]